jgi:hypothetical protein
VHGGVSELQNGGSLQQRLEKLCITVFASVVLKMLGKYAWHQKLACWTPTEDFTQYLLYLDCIYEFVAIFALVCDHCIITSGQPPGRIWHLRANPD